MSGTMTTPDQSPGGLPDDADRRRIALGALDRTLFVEAGAGTGKTSQLVERICNLVVRRDVPLTSIAAITFTEAAAAELQNRVRIALEQRGAAATDPVEAARCRAALADADRSVIATLHGFASRLLGEFSILAGLPPAVRVLDEVASQLAAEQRWGNFVDALYDDPANDELLERAALLGVPIEQRFKQQVTLREVADRLNASWDLLEPVAARRLGALAPIDPSPLSAAVDEVEALLGSCTDPADKLLVRLQELVGSVRAVLGSDPSRALPAIQAERSGWATYLHRGQRGNWPDVEHAREVGLAVSKEAGKIVDAAVDEVLRHLLVRTARFVLDSAEQRRRDGGLEFHDLLVLARNLLRTEAAARDALHGRYTHLLLDEFQDTDPIQIELATRIAAAVAAAPTERWSEHDTTDGSLFFVGDPKQSIYRFRRADIALFLEARDRFGSGDGLARLTTNFRTVEPVLDWVNAFFGMQMPAEVEGRQPAYEPLHAHRRADSGADHRPLVLGGPHPDPKVPASVLREAEAADVAATIARILARPEEWPVHDRSVEGGDWRPARPDDITVLLPTRTSLPYLRDALERHRIAYRLATGTLAYDTPEVRDVLAVLRAVDDPGDESSLVAALRSPLYACSDVDLFTFRQAGGRWDLRSDPPPALAADHPVPAAFGHLRALHEQRWWRSPSSLIATLLEERHGWLLGFGAPRPDDVWRRLRFLVDQARAFEESGGSGLRAFVDWAALQGADGGRVHEPLLPETDEATVRIMTIHGAKGLEFPITILSGMTSLPGGNRGGVSLLWTSDELPELSMGKGRQTEGHQLRADLEAEMDVEEKLRLLYVAATRARDHLVLSGHHKAGTTSTYAQMLWAFAEGEGAGLIQRPESGPAEEPDPVDPVDPEVSRPVTAPLGEVHDERQRWLDDRAALIAPFVRPSVVSATAMADLVHGSTADGPLVDEDDDGADLDAGADADRPFTHRRGRVGTAVGQAVHATLEAIDLTAPTAVAELVRRHCAQGAIGRFAPTVEKLVRAALAGESVRLAAANPHHKELYVAAPIGDRVIEGYVDLLIETPDGLVVVDYKTDSVSSESEIAAKLDRYELQAASYAVALEAVTGAEVVECRFVFCRASGAVERSVRDLPGAKARVRAALGA